MMHMSFNLIVSPLQVIQRQKVAVASSSGIECVWQTALVASPLSELGLPICESVLRTSIVLM